MKLTLSSSRLMTAGNFTAGTLSIRLLGNGAHFAHCNLQKRSARTHKGDVELRSKEDLLTLLGISRNSKVVNLHFVPLPHQGDTSLPPFQPCPPYRSLVNCPKGPSEPQKYTKEVRFSLSRAYRNWPKSPFP